MTAAKSASGTQIVHRAIEMQVYISSSAHALALQNDTSNLHAALYLLANPTSYKSFDQPSCNIRASLDVLVGARSRHMEENDVSVLALLKRLGQTCIKDELAEVASSVLGYPDVCSRRYKRLPRVEKVVIGRLGVENFPYYVCGIRRRTSLEYWRELLLPPNLLPIFITDSAFDIGQVVRISMRLGLNRVVRSCSRYSHMEYNVWSSTSMGLGVIL